MSERISIGVLGAGTIGCYVGGKLLAARRADVVLVGRPRIGRELAASGLAVADLDAEPQRIGPDEVTVATDAADLARCDAVLVCVKSAQSAAAADQLAPVLAPEAVVVSLQNGVRNPEVLGERLGRPVIAGIVSFNVRSRGGGLFQRTMDGPLILEDDRSPAARRLFDALSAAGLAIERRADVAPDQWTKLVVNSNNAVSALSGAPTREILLSPGYRRAVAAVVEEALAVLRAASIRPARLRGVPLGWMPRILRLPTPLVRLVTRAQMKVDPEARSSMWEDLSRHKTTEVDFLNGEIVRLAERVGVDAPINRRIVEMIHAAEEASAGPPNLDPEALASALGL